MTICQTCVLSENRKSPEVPLWDSIYPARHFDVAHAYNSTLPGWIVLVLKRHAAAIDELTEEESVELGILIRKVSVALKHAVGCSKTYVMQFAEAQGHSHVHFHIVPRMADIVAENVGRNVFNYLGGDEDRFVSEAHLNEIARKMREVM
jgi:diadenosine tetraphosphate (Ap4A) HIT family hydrolase